jgi:2-haloacid dehalogenase
MEAGEKEYTYISLSGHYVTFFDIFRSIFYRTLWQAGIKEPHAFASDEDREFLLIAYQGLKTRPAVSECFTKLRDAGFTVWALASGDTKRVARYLSAGGTNFPEENFISCDSVGVGKPDPQKLGYLVSNIIRKIIMDTTAVYCRMKLLNKYCTNN